MLENITVEQMILLGIIILGGISVMTGLISFLIEDKQSRGQWLGDWLQGVSTEMVGAVVTTILFTLVLGSIENQQIRAERQQDLIARMGSTVNVEAIAAVEELRDEGWLRDGTLRGGEFYSANLTGALMRGADLNEAILFDADLQGATLEGASLVNTTLQAADLQNANLRAADLSGATLNAADLGGADLTGADLRGAILTDANLAGAILTNTQFDSDTALPDAVYNSDALTFDGNWTPDTDMRRFTDPDHPNFWRPVPDEFGIVPEWYDAEGMSTDE